MITQDSVNWMAARKPSCYSWANSGVFASNKVNGVITQEEFY